MAKAILGYLATPTAHESHEVALLRRRVADLEAEITRLKSENDALHTALSHDLADKLSTADLLAPAAS